MPASHRPRDRRTVADDDRYEYGAPGEDAVDPLDPVDSMDDYGVPETDETEPEARRPAGRARTSRRLTASTAGRAALDYMAELTGKGVEGVTLVKPAGDGWTVEVEVVEDHRIPSSGDTLGIYAIDLDSEGDLVSYRRVRSYKRAKGDTGGAY
ncbi:gas vesicle protein [Sphaerisporangium dianthi]|uniref:Gas vesicle protein n=1 Tax=Sphaerisporangium dianthi TaxID=1436120 RepID=A0ABV9CIV6_9ACTN